MRGGEILIVDDDAAMARTLADVVGLHGWSATTVLSGEAAVDAVEERSYTLVLMDIKMPGMNGVQALRAIRAHRPAARVILMTAYSATELVQEAIEEGVVDVLSKPVALPRLLGLIEQAVEPHPILVVDDDPAFLRALCAGLESNGIETRSAQNLDAALGLLEDQDIRVVLLDLRLNGFEGGESVAAIREVRPEVLVILFSGYPAELQRVEARLPEGWIVASLTKPFDPGVLIDLLERIDAA